jgi:hypothetical protein
LSLALASLYEPPKQGSKLGPIHKVSSRDLSRRAGINIEGMQ